MDSKIITKISYALNSQNIASFDLLLALGKTAVVPNNIIVDRRSRVIKRDGKDTPEGYLRNTIEDLTELNFRYKSQIISLLQQQINSKTLSGFEYNYGEVCMQRPGNLRGFSGMTPRGQTIMRPRRRLRGLGSVDAADDAKNSISDQVNGLESRAKASNVDPQSVYLEATTIQKNLQNYNAWDSGPHAWTSVSNGGWYASNDLYNRCQALIDQFKPAATAPQPTASPVAKPIEQTVTNVAATGAVTQVEQAAPVTSGGILDKSDDALANFFIQNYPNATSVENLATLSDNEKARFQPAISIEGLLTLLSTTVDRFKGGAFKKGECVVNNHPDYLIPTIQDGIIQVPTQTLQNFYNQQLAGLVSAWQVITPEQRQAGCQQLKQDIDDAVKKAKEENDRLGPCAIEREAASIALAKNSPILYALSTDKFSNAAEDTMRSMYKMFGYDPGCHPPKWPLYLVIGLLIAIPTILVLRKGLKVATFGVLRKKKSNKKKHSKKRKK